MTVDWREAGNRGFSKKSVIPLLLAVLFLAFTVFHVSHSIPRAIGWAPQSSGTTAPPTITILSPNSGVQGQSLSVTVTGTHLTEATTLTFGSGITVNAFSVDSSAQITANIIISSTAIPASRTVLVTTPGGTCTMSEGFTVNRAPPTITSVSPEQGLQGQSLSVTMTGTYFTGTTSVSFDLGINVDSFTVDDATQMTVNISIGSAATPGPRRVSVTTLGGTVFKYDGFRVDQAPPTITILSPNSGVQGQIMSITVTGTHLTEATTLTFGSGITVNTFAVDSSAQITANIIISSTAIPALRTVSVTTPSGMGVRSDGFRVNQAPPTITSVSPEQEGQGQSLSITITGTRFSGATGVSLGAGIAVNSFRVENDRLIEVEVQIGHASATGARNVSVTTAGGTVTLPSAFTVVTAPPTVSGVDPFFAMRGETLDVTVTGGDFAGTTAVDFGQGITVNSFTLDSSSQITVSITVDAAAVAGSRDIAVSADQGTGTIDAVFEVTVPAPAVTGLSFNSAQRGQAVEVVINGTNLDGVTEINLGDGVTVKTFYLDGSTRIVATLTIANDASTGLRNVSVITPRGSSTLPEGFKVEWSSNPSSVWLWLGAGLILAMLSFFFMVTGNKTVKKRSLLGPWNTR